MPDDHLDLTAQTAPLADAAAAIARLLPVRTLRPELAGVLLRAEADTLLLAASDGELTVRMCVPATVYGAGEAVISRRGLAATLSALDAPEARLVVEGSRVALRTATARFALPRLDLAAHPRPDEPPPVAGTVAGALLRAAAVPVAGAASREHALPIFTGVRVRSGDDRLSLVATDRFRMAVASVAWQPVDGGVAVDALVPGVALADVARLAGRAEEITVHADGDRFGLAWPGASVVTASLGSPFPDRQVDRLLDTTTECAVDVEADPFIAAVDRAAPYAGPHGRVTIDVTDGVLVVRGNDALAGESEETIKAAVRGDHVTRHYQARFLLDALRPFAGGTARVRVQGGMRPTLFTAAHAVEGIDLTYVVVPMKVQDTAG
jgi:DNA polymerase-3 subunit beta